MSSKSQCSRIYLVPSASIHQIRQRLQIILDYAEINGSDTLKQQVFLIDNELDTYAVDATSSA